MTPAMNAFLDFLGRQGARYLPVIANTYPKEALGSYGSQMNAT